MSARWVINNPCGGAKGLGEVAGELLALSRLAASTKSNSSEDSKHFLVGGTGLELLLLEADTRRGSRQQSRLEGGGAKEVNQGDSKTLLVVPVVIVLLDLGLVTIALANRGGAMRGRPIEFILWALVLLLLLFKLLGANRGVKEGLAGTGVNLGRTEPELD